MPFRSFSQAGFAITDANGLASFTYAADNAGTDSIVSFVGNLSDVVNVDWEGVSPTVTVSTPEPSSQFEIGERFYCCLLYTSPSPRDRTRSRMPSSA